MFTSLKNLLPKSLRKAGAVRRVRATMVLDQAIEVLSAVFSPEMAAHMTPKTFIEGRLTIQCDKSVYAQEIVLRSDEIRARMNARLGGEEVTRVTAR
jgi:predicted nucleic acid-binding Zn ribbon protein